MPATFTTYPPSGRTYAIPFEYISKSHVHVSVGDQPVSYTWLSVSLIRLDVDPVNPVTVRRITPRETLLTVFVDGSTMTGRDLNGSARQLFFIGQELQDALENAILGGGGGGSPGGVPKAYIDSQDAADRAYADSKVADLQSQIDKIKLDAGQSPEVYLDAYFITGQVAWDAAFAKAILDLPYGGRVRLGNKTQNYVFNNLTIPEGISLQGVYENPPYPGSGNTINLNGLQWVRVKAGGTLTLKSGAGIVGVAISPESMSFPQPNSTAWTGTAITISGHQTLIEDCLVLGFGLGVKSYGQGRGTIKNLFLDCNNAIDLNASYDTTRWSGLHCWPFATQETYAASYNKLPVGDPNRSPDGYDSRINVRSGIGLKFRGSADDVHVDDAIMVGFMTGYDFEGTGGIYLGRVWTECYSREGTVGMRFGVNCDHIFTADAQLWGTASPLVMDMMATEEINFGHILVVHPKYAPVTIYGGNLHFDQLVVRSAANTGNIVNIVEVSGGKSTVTRVTGTILDYTFGGTTAVVSVPANYQLGGLTSLDIQAPYRNAGTPLIAGGLATIPEIAAADTILLPTTGTDFRITGSGTITHIWGYSPGRIVRLHFANANVTLSYGGDINGGLVGKTGNTNTRQFPAGGCSELRFDQAYGNWRELNVVDFAAPGGGTTTLPDIPSASVLGNETAGTTKARPVTMSGMMDTLVTTVGSVPVRFSTGWSGVGPQAAGYVLTDNGPGSTPSFKPLAAVTSQRHQYVADVGATTHYNNGQFGVGTVYEPYPGAMVTGFSGGTDGRFTGARYRYGQYLINGSWYTAANTQ